MSAPEDFAVGEEVLVFYGQLLFGAKILKIDLERDDDKVFYIHYVGWTKRHDTWVPLEVMNKNTEDNRKYQQELQIQMVVEREAAKKAKKLAREEARKKKKEAKRIAREEKTREKEAAKERKRLKTEQMKVAQEAKKVTKKKKKTTTKKVTTSKKATTKKQVKSTTRKSPQTFQIRQRMPIPWHWKSDLRYPKEDPKGWSAYTLEETARIEEAFKKKQKSLKLNSDVMIDFIRVVQYHIGKRNDARPIKRGGIPVKGKKRKYVMYTNAH